MNKSMIESKANETLNKAQLNKQTDTIDVIKVAKELGFVVGNAGLDDDIDGFIIIEKGKKELLGKKTDRIIGVNASKELTWKRFIIAHEIGHYVLHYNEKENNGMYAHREHKKGKDDKENEADFFAANLLMPREAFTNRFNELKQKNLTTEEIIVLLADKFCVTHIMAERRLRELEINA